MAETRTVKLSVVMTPSMRDELDAYAEACDWTASTAAVNLIRQALEAMHRAHGDQCRMLPDSTAPAQRPGSGPPTGPAGTATVPERNRKD